MKKLCLILLVVVSVFGCSKSQSKQKAGSDQAVVENSIAVSNGDESVYEITFVELGSEGCVPCRKMIPVMDQVRENYAEKVNVVFYDVWKQSQKKYAEEYNIRLIPTQVFLDNEGNEFFRHEGYFSYQEIEKIIENKLKR